MKLMLQLVLPLKGLIQAAFWPQAKQGEFQELEDVTFQISSTAGMLALHNTSSLWVCQTGQRIPSETLTRFL